MARRTILAVATLAAILAAVLPLVAIALYAHARAVQFEKEHLIEYGGWTLQRAERNLDLAKSVLDRLGAERWTACSPEHIARMRELTLDTRSVDQIGHLVDGRVVCTSWGELPAAVAVGAPDTILSDDAALYLNSLPVGTGGTAQLGLARGDTMLWMRHERLVDVLTDTPMTLGIATRDGHLISLNGAADPDLVARLLQEDGFGQHGDTLYATAQDEDLRAFALTDDAAIRDRLDDELLLLVPLALGMSAALVGLVVWLSRQRLSTRKELEFAIRHKEFVAHYQPIIDLRTGRCVGAEALMRWRRPDGEWMSPNVFIPMAEQTGLIEPLTDLMIQHVVTDLAVMLRADRGIHIAINICPADMQTGRFLPVLARAIGPAGIAPAQIWLEATERGFMNAAAARATFDAARQAGHQVAIDDFGTGYSSLSLLEALPLDVLKIDKSFIDAIGTEAATSIVVPHIINMAQGLKLRIVAEGVETVAQQAYLQAAGVDFAQGWLYSKALSAADFTAYHRARNAGPIDGVNA